MAEEATGWNVSLWLRTRRDRLVRGIRIALGLGAVGAFVLLLWDVGFDHTPAQRAVVLAWQRCLLVILLGLFGGQVVATKAPGAFVRKRWYEAAVLVGGVLGVLVATLWAGTWPPGAEGTGPAALHRWTLRAVLIAFPVLLAGQQVTRLPQLPIRPEVLLLIVFGAFITLGTILLMLPRATVVSGAMPLVDALFTATSAVCVTGLIVVDTGTYFTLFGQIVILTLIQVGAIGVITSATAIAVLFGGATQVGTRTAIRDILDTDAVGEVGQLLPRIILSTLAIEAVGAVLMFVAVDLEFDHVGERIYFSVFHAVSAFCNAGFSTLSTSLSDPALATDLDLNLVFMVLIVLGGLGFVVLREVTSWRRWRSGRHSRYHVQLRLVGIATAALLVVGAVGFFMLDQGGALGAAPAVDTRAERALAALFQSVTARTAGFNTVDISAMTTSATLLLLLLMFIGASPGSTGGGIRTTTFSILVLFVRAQLRGEQRVDVFRRTLPGATVRRAVVVLLTALIAIGGSTLLLAITEDAPLLDVLFEAVSAFGTVGLSRGLTDDLTTPGRLIIIVDMFAGRVGVIALAMFLAQQARRLPYRYPEETVMIV